MPLLEDRSRNVMDGTYVNVPDLHAVQPSRNIGLRDFNNNVLIHNWFEERLPFEKREYPKTSTYSLDYKPYADARPDVVLRRRLIASSDGHGTKNLVGMHNFDSSKNFITLYDEHINRRARPPPLVPVGQQFPEQRQWKIANDCWVPEKSDYPLQAEPTRWGLLEEKRAQQEREKEKYKRQLSNLSEYTDRYQRPAREVYTRQRTSLVSKEISASVGELGKPSASTESSFVRSRKHPRTYYYLGKVPPGDGSLDAFSMRNFETLTPLREPTSINKL